MQHCLLSCDVRVMLPKYSCLINICTASMSVAAVQDGTQKSQKVFVNIPTEVGATEAEEIGVLQSLQCIPVMCCV